MTIYHSSEWKNILLDTYRYKPFYYGKYGDNKDAFLPAMLIKNRLLGKKFLCSIPFGDEAGPVAERSQYAINVFEFLNEIFRKENLDYIEIKGVNKDLIKIADIFGYKEVYENFRFIIDLNKPLEYIYGNFKKNIKRHIKKAGNLGITMKIENSVNDFYKLHSRTMKRLGTPPHSIDFFENILQYLGKNAVLFNAFFKKSCVSSIILLIDHNMEKSRYAFGAYDWDCKNINANILLFYEAIKYSKGIGCKYFDFGVSRPGSGVWEFKKNWCSEPPVKEYYMYKMRNKDIIDIRNEKMRTLNKIWKDCIPLSVANIIGPFIRKQLGK